MTTKKVTVVLHGGLGNQLFQYFKAALYANDTDGALVVTADLLGRYKAAHTLELLPLLKLEMENGRPSIAPVNRLCQLRLPKIIARLFGKEVVVVFPFFGAVVDGYFQTPLDYVMHQRVAWQTLLQRWRLALDLSDVSATRLKKITHIRLSDFFHSEKEALLHAEAQLRSLKEETDIVTDQEELVSAAIKSVALPFTVRLVPSRGFTGWEVFRLFARYDRISTNGSTLAFWAAVLARVEFTSTNKDHEELWHLLTQE